MHDIVQKVSSLTFLSVKRGSTFDEEFVVCNNKQVVIVSPQLNTRGVVFMNTTEDECA